MLCGVVSNSFTSILPTNNKFHSNKSISCSLPPGSVAEPKVTEPLLLNAVRGLDVDRPLVWLLRQADRYMKSYQAICEKHPSFRERFENVDLVVEIFITTVEGFQA